jgi:hypothetical protein
MIDWWMVAANGLWILGLALLLAALSYHHWLAGETGWRRRDLFSACSFQVPWTSGLFLAFTGWALAQAPQWWEKTLWLVLAAWCGWRMLSSLARALRQWRTSRRD